MEKGSSRALKAARVRLGYTQKEVAKQLGIGETSYVHRENGKQEFTVSEVNRLRKVLKLSNYDIIDIFFPNDEAEELNIAAEKVDKRFE